MQAAEAARRVGGVDALVVDRVGQVRLDDLVFAASDGRSLIEARVGILLAGTHKALGAIVVQPEADRVNESVSSRISFLLDFWSI